MRLYCGLDTRADALLSGCLVALLAAWGLLPQSSRALAVTGAAALTSAAALAYMIVRSTLEHVQFYYGYFTLVALMMATILVRLLSGRSRVASAVLGFAPLAAVGRISYALYLFHIPVILWLFPDRLGWQHPGRTLFATGLTFLAAVTSYYCVERPFLRLKDRLRAPSPAAPVDPATGATPPRAAA
jgi:peptidoglycan/LPS O-acetylase OafA/YrhL